MYKHAAKNIGRIISYTVGKPPKIDFQLKLWADILKEAGFEAPTQILDYEHKLRAAGIWVRFRRLRKFDALYSCGFVMPNGRKWDRRSYSAFSNFVSEYKFRVKTGLMGD